MSNRVSQNLDTSQAKIANDSDPFSDPPAAQTDNEVVSSYGSQLATGAVPQSANVEPDDTEVVTTQPVDSSYQSDSTALQPPVPFVISERSSLSALGTNDLGASKESQPLASVIVPTLPAGDSAEVFGERPADLQPERKRPRKFFWLLVAVAVVVLIFLAVFLPVFFVVVKKSSSAASGSGGSTGSGKPTKGSPSASNAITGGNGSTVTMANGTTFTYKNPFGGFWVEDPANPFNNNAQANSWTPPLNTSWTWGKDRVYGVNLGGWLVMEPFIRPDIYQRYPGAVDEFTLSTLMAADTANGGLAQLETHYDTFVTEKDIAEMAGAGLNWIRVPLAFWAIETWEGEPYLEGTSWKYFVRFLGWARKYGMRVFLDLHAVPGSQNGYNHSGVLGVHNFLQGIMGLANAQRTLYYLRIITEFISQPQYRDVVPMFGIINEPTLTMDILTPFYLQAYNIIRNITGVGAGKGPYIVIQDGGFIGDISQTGYLAGADRMALDQHPYFAFEGITDPVAVVGPSGQYGGNWPIQACTNWLPGAEAARAGFGVTVTGEFSAALNDCGLFMIGVNVNSTNPECPIYENWENYNDTMKQGVMNEVLASMDALGDWFFWTWKVGPDQTGNISSPLWSYQLGLQNGWIPTDPRTSQGKCASLITAPADPFNGTFLPWQTGGVPSSIAASSSALYPWPPTSISSAGLSASLLPTYTNTGPITTLPVPTFTGAASKVSQGVNGWFNQADTQGGIVTVAGCSYPNEYSPTFAVVPTAPCTGAAGPTATTK